MCVCSIELASVCSGFSVDRSAAGLNDVVLTQPLEQKQSVSAAPSFNPNKRVNDMGFWENVVPVS